MDETWTPRVDYVPGNEAADATTDTDQEVTETSQTVKEVLRLKWPKEKVAQIEGVDEDGNPFLQEIVLFVRFEVFTAVTMKTSSGMCRRVDIL